MKKIGFLVAVSMALSQLCAAQQTYKQDGGFDPSRLLIGGNFGLSFGNGYSLINLSPQVGYRFTPMFAAGAGISYIHYNTTDFYDNKFSQNYAGINLFGRFYPIRFLFIQAQPELDYVWGKVTFPNDEPSQKIPTQFVPCVLLGGGAALPAGRGSFTISILYDVVQNIYSPYYQTAVYAFGYSVGF